MERHKEAVEAFKGSRFGGLPVGVDGGDEEVVPNVAATKDNDVETLVAREVEVIRPTPAVRRRGRIRRHAKSAERHQGGGVVVVRGNGLEIEGCKCMVGRRRACIGRANDQDA